MTTKRSTGVTKTIDELMAEAVAPSLEAAAKTAAELLTARGPKGDKGEVGSTGSAGASGAAGPAGAQGIQGIAGPAGADGTSPSLASTYPIDSIYVTASATNPATTFGFGTWAEQIGLILGAHCWKRTA